MDVSASLLESMLELLSVLMVLSVTSFFMLSVGDFFSSDGVLPAEPVFTVVTANSCRKSANVKQTHYSLEIKYESQQRFKDCQV